MKSFLVKIVAYISLIVIIIIISIRFIQLRSNFNPEELKIIVAGDSNTETAINDHKIKYLSNISRSGESYFYTYRKLKYLVKRNRNFNKIYLSFSPHNVLRSDDYRLTNGGRIYNDLIDYISILDLKSIWILFRLDPKNSFFSLIKAPVYLFYFKNNTCWGGYLKLERNNVDNEIKIMYEEPAKTWSFRDLDSIEVKNLRLIVELCKKNNIELFFINTPKRIEYVEYSNRYDTFKKFYNKNFSEIVFFDYTYEINQMDFFGDLIHLNAKGSEKFTQIFKEKQKLNALNE